MIAGHRGLEQSVMTRLATRARALEVDPNVLLARFVTERFLYRLSRSQHTSRFVLKGATLMPLWLGDTARPTRDADLAGFGDMSAANLESMFRDVFELEVQPDGVSFDTATMRIAPIREHDEYGGNRMTTIARIGRSRVRLQIDIGIGDTVSPDPSEIDLPPILDFPAPRLRAYRPETSIAEKFHAIATLGTANSRMKDFYDIDRLAAELSFDAAILREAIRQTFRRRETELPGSVPAGLSVDFAIAPEKQKQWQAFVRRLTPGDVRSFVEVVSTLRKFLMPVIAGVDGSWAPGGPWRASAEEP